MSAPQSSPLVDQQVVDDLRAGLRASVQAMAGREVHPLLRAAFPRGLAPGVHTLDGPLSVGLGLLAGSEWSGIIGLPDVSAEAINEWGIAPHRLVLIPQVGTAWLEIVAELAEVAETIVACAPPQVSEAMAGRLVARLRHRNTALLVHGGWPRPQSQIRARVEGWGGLGVGHGYLTHQRLLIEVTERHRTRRHRMIRGHGPASERERHE